MNQTRVDEKPAGPEAFLSLKAENEPWLEACFVPPPGLVEQLVGDRSVIIFGPSGSGKSALYNHLVQRAVTGDGVPERLIARWDPSPLPTDVSGGIAAVHTQAGQILDACVDALLTAIARHPSLFLNASPLNQEVFTWFVRRVGQSNLDIRLQHYSKEFPEAEPVLRHFLTPPAREVLNPEAPPNQIAARLARSIKSTGLQGVWVIVDNLEMWAEFDPLELSKQLNLFLATLSLFEQSDFSYKLFLPARLEHALSSNSGLIRRRVQSYKIQWNPELLKTLIDKRLALAFDNPKFSLKKLCNAKGLVPWLKHVGADSPREWLEQVRPLVTCYFQNSRKKTIDQKTWQKLRKDTPPRLYFNDTRKQVVVGARTISLADLPAKAYDMLRYLYQQPEDAVISRADLYFKVYRELDYVPRGPADKNFEALEEYRKIIDTNLWRLRKAIEPDPKNPVLLITVRGYGVKLNSRW